LTASTSAPPAAPTSSRIVATAASRDGRE
jgi:hypothetical protein